MENIEETIVSIQRAYPKCMSKEQFYKVAHISKATALYLLKSGLVRSIDSGKKSRRYTIKTKDVVKYLRDREINPQKYLVKDGWYSTRSLKTQDEAIRRTMLNINESQRRKLYVFIKKELSEYDDLLTTNQICELLGYSSSTPANWLATGKIKGFLIAGRYEFPKSSLVEFLISDESFRISRMGNGHQLLLFSFIKANKIKN